MDNIDTHMSWKRNCNIPDKVRQDHTLVVESVWFGDGHAAKLYNSEKMDKEDDESTVVTDAENKVDKYLVKVFRKIKQDFKGNWVSSMDYKMVQPKNKIFSVQTN